MDRRMEGRGPQQQDRLKMALEEPSEASMRGKEEERGKAAPADAERPRPRPHPHRAPALPGPEPARGRSPRVQGSLGPEQGPEPVQGSGPEQGRARRYSRAQDEPPQPERGAEAAPQPLGLHGGDGAKRARAAPSGRAGPAAGGAGHGPALPVWGLVSVTVSVLWNQGIPAWSRDCPLSWH